MKLPRVNKKFVKIVLPLLIPFLIWFGVFLVEKRSAHLGYEAAVADWEAIGGILDVSAWKPDPIPDAENGGVELAEAFRLFRASRTYRSDAEFFTEVDRDRLGRDESPDEHEARTFNEITDLVRRAMMKSSCQLDTPFYEPGCQSDRRLTHLVYIDEIASHLQDSSSGRLGQGALDEAQLNDAVENIAMMRFLSDAAYNEQSMQSYLTSSQLESKMLGMINDLCSNHALTDVQHELVAQCLELPELEPRLRDCLITDAAHMVYEFQSPFCTDLRTFFNAHLIDQNMAHLLDVNRVGIGLLDQSPRLPRRPTLDVPARQEAVEELGLLSGWISATSAAVGLLGQQHRDRMLFRDAWAVCAMRLQDGIYPETFETSVDPTTGTPFVYERTERGFRLWPEGVSEDAWVRIDWE